MNNTLPVEEVHAQYKAIETEGQFDSHYKNLSIYQFLQRTCDKYPDNPALSFQLKSGANDKAVTLNWSEFNTKVTQTANLFHSLGIKENDVVAYMLPIMSETVICLMAGMSAGIVNPINPLLEEEQIAALLKETNAKVLVTLKSFPKTDIAQKAHNIATMAPNIETIIEVDLLPYLSAPLKWIVPFIRPSVKADHQANVIDFHKAIDNHNGNALNFKQHTDDRICAYFHTGGTTGMPKVAQHRQSGVIYNGWVIAKLLFTETDNVICPLPFFHCFASYPIWMSCVASGAQMILPTPAGYRGEGVMDNFWQLVERWKSTIIITVPTAAAMLMQKPVNADISTLKLAVSGSAPFPTELFKKFQHQTGVEILEGYGMTEATCIVSCNPVEGEKKIGSVGLPMPLTDVRIFDIDSDGKVNRECATNETGEICISNPGVVVGATYIEKEKNKNLYANTEFLRTGDLGRIDDDGYVWITGRAKDLIIRGGHNIDPAMIEEAIAGHPDVAFVGVIGQPDEMAGEIPCAYVELVENASANTDELLAYAKEHIPERAAIPKYLEIIDELPKTAVGKVFKPDLRKRAITRIYNHALKQAGLDAVVSQVSEDKKLGLVAELKAGAKDVEEESINKKLGNFTIPWRWSQ